jgi:hypothetical protein
MWQKEVDLSCTQEEQLINHLAPKSPEGDFPVICVVFFLILFSVKKVINH